MEIMSMKRILLFLLLFCIFSGVVFAQSDSLPKLVLSPLISFDQIFVMLKQILMQLFLRYYHLLIGIAVVVMFLSYLQSFLEDRRMREEREYRERIEKRQIDQYLVKERNLIRRYARVDKERALFIQEEMYRDHSEASEEELGLAAIEDDDDVLANNIDRAGPYWRPDGSEEGSDLFFGDTATISESSTVVIPENKRKQDRLYRSMEDDDDYSGY
jgi:hypothetical protein